MTVDFFTKCDTYVVQPAVRVYEGLTSHWNSLDRIVCKWSDNTLPTVWSETAKKIFHSLPVATAIFITPFWTNVCMGSLFYVTDLGYGPFAPATYDTAYTGASIGFGAKSLTNGLEFVHSVQPKYALYALINGVASYLLFQRTGLYTTHMQKI